MQTEVPKQIILDASALIALISKEPGQEIVTSILPYAVMSSVNVAEVAKFLIEGKNLTKEQVPLVIKTLISKIVNFDAEQAFVSAELTEQTKNYGLSLGDRACITLGIFLGAPIYTADKIWSRLKLDNIEIKLIR